ncbi:MAG TPA: ATP-binding protein, partial [Candidatus Sulfotelmatobacter sp.]|nr:ATP-binding protein [Candidatus Sulfotelmatobacter sp.]
FQEQFAVFATDRPVSATLYQLQFSFLDQTAPSYLADFGVSVTSDENPTLQSRWVPLLPELALANDTNLIRITGRTIRLNASHPGVVVTLRARAPFKGITGFRLRLNSLSNREGRLPPSIGRGPDGNFLLTEFEVEAEPLHSSNIALGCQVYNSGIVPANLPTKNLTDGFISTYSHPDPSLNGDSFYFTLDLGQEVALDHIVVRGRRDGGDSNRLSAYSIDVLVDSKETRRLTKWNARMHLDGSHPSSDVDVIRQRDGVGTFSGRAIRIYNQPGQTMQPQIAELEVYPSLHPQAQDWLADDVSLKVNRKIVVPPGTRKLAFTIASHQSGIIPTLLTYRWRIPGWSDSWRETDPGGNVELAPPPPPGTFELQVQAQHTDGVWDESGQSLTFQTTRLWWRNPYVLVIVAGAAGTLTAVVWWWIYGWRIKRNLALAEQHLELHRERLRIARDMHDEMGARLTYIALLADRTLRETNPSAITPGNPLERLAENARSAVAALDNIVWAVNPQHDTIGSLADHLCDYAPNYLQAAGIDCALDIHVGTPDRPLGLTVRHGLLMATKEAMQNVVKHSGATSVRLCFREEHGNVEISISDNGSGLAGEPPRDDDHSGLNNMRQRLAELGGRCEIGPGDGGRGTCVRFTLTMGNHR